MRHAKQDTVLPTGGGPDGQSPMMIRKGCGIGLLIYHLHRSEHIYGPDANIFRPERWEGPDGEALLKEVRSNGGFVDFNIGPRSCLGSAWRNDPVFSHVVFFAQITLTQLTEDFALMEASYAAIRILQAFPHLRLPPGTSNEPVGVEEQIMTLSVIPGDGVQVVVT